MSINTHLLSLQKFTLKPSIKDDNTQAIKDLFYIFKSISVMVDTDGLAAIEAASSEAIQSLIKDFKKYNLYGYSFTTLVNNFTSSTNRPSDYEMQVMSYINYITNGSVTFSVGDEPATIMLDEKHYTIYRYVSETEACDIVKGLLETSATPTKDNFSLLAELSITDTELFRQSSETANIKHRSIKALVNCFNFKHDLNVSVDTCTDILRFINLMNPSAGIDHAMLTTFRVPRLGKALRYRLMQYLEPIITEEDVKRHLSKWKAVFHALHVNAYKGFPNIKAIAKKVRNNVTLSSFHGLVQSAIANADVDAVLKLMVTRPSELARSLDALCRKFDDVTSLTSILDAFESVSNTVNTKILLQMYNHFLNRDVQKSTRLVNHPKKLIAIDSIEPLHETLTGAILNIIKNSLKQQYATRGTFTKGQKVYIDESLKDLMIPLNLINGSNQVAVERGSRFPLTLTNDSILRLFVYWKDTVDIDLWATFYDDNFNEKEYCCFRTLTLDYCKHSGDVRSAPDGGAEFIDIDVSKVPNNIRYILCNIVCFSGKPFTKVNDCQSGFMLLDSSSKSTLFDISKVSNRFSLTRNTVNQITFAVDIKQSQMINLDYDDTTIVENSTKDVFKHLMENKGLSLYELFKIHVDACGAILCDEADVIVSKDGDISPFDISIINSKFV